MLSLSANNTVTYRKCDGCYDYNFKFLVCNALLMLLCKWYGTCCKIYFKPSLCVCLSDLNFNLAKYLLTERVCFSSEDECFWPEKKH